MNHLQQFREQIDAFMQQHPQSPIEPEQRQSFSGLRYFPENTALIIETALDADVDQSLLEIPTNTGEVKQFRRFGRFTLTVDGKHAALTVLSNPDGSDLFLPFRDQTSGKESYGAGRYLDDSRPGIVEIGRNEYRIDFNFSYNPFCAYSADFSCPLPPPENWLTVPIRAGEMAFSS